jgi:adenosylmethionine-8-amino-7-oxononanoate aminotransferase
MGHCLSVPSGPREHTISKEENDYSSGVSQPSSPSIPRQPPSASASSALPFLSKAKGHYLYLDNGKKLLDGCGGAAVACIGHGRRDVAKVIGAQAKKFSYVSWAHFDNKPTRDLSDWLLESTGGKMRKAYIMCSGTLRLAKPYCLFQRQ